MRFDFSYTTPTPDPTPEDPNAITQVPSSFSLGGITFDVATMLRFGLRRGQQLGKISNVLVEQVNEQRQTVTADPT